MANQHHLYIHRLGVMPELGKGLNGSASTETSNASIAGAVSAAPPWLRIQPSRGWAALNLAGLSQCREVIFLSGIDGRHGFTGNSVWP